MGSATLISDSCVISIIQRSGKNGTGRWNRPRFEKYWDVCRYRAKQRVRDGVWIWQQDGDCNKKRIYSEADAIFEAQSYAFENHYEFDQYAYHNSKVNHPWLVRHGKAVVVSKGEF